MTAGTGTLVRLALRRDRVFLPVSLVCLVFALVVTVVCLLVAVIEWIVCLVWSLIEIIFCMSHANGGTMFLLTDGTVMIFTVTRTVAMR